MHSSQVALAQGVLIPVKAWICAVGQNKGMMRSSEKPLSRMLTQERPP